MTPEEELQNSRDRLSLKSALEIKAVRDVFWRIIELGGLYSTSGALGIEEANYRGGRKDLALELIELVDETSPDNWILMQTENREDIKDA